MKKIVADDLKQAVRDHINAFPRIESHYCRARTKKEYLDGSLSITKMYNMYCDKCDLHKQKKVKEHLYRHIFNTEFNIEFQKPKKDRCDLCEEFKMKGTELTGDAKVKYESHVAGKLATKEERDRDRDGQAIVVCFDLQNVFSFAKS